MTDSALIVGAGAGLSAALARLFASEDMKVAIAARNTGKLGALCEETGAIAYACDATVPDQVAKLFDDAIAAIGTPRIVVYNAGSRTSGPITEVDPGAARHVLLANAYGAFLIAQQAARAMLDAGGGAILFTGASAGIKGYPKSAPFAMGKFALRGLCQSLARELSPQNVHVAHFVIDGLIRSEERGAPYDDPEKTLDPDEIAKTYLSIARQDKSAWTWEVELRPSVETF